MTLGTTLLECLLKCRLSGGLTEDDVIDLMYSAVVGEDLIPVKIKREYLENLVKKPEFSFEDAMKMVFACGYSCKMEGFDIDCKDDFGQFYSFISVKGTDIFENYDEVLARLESKIEEKSTNCD